MLIQQISNSVEQQRVARMRQSYLDDPHRSRSQLEYLRTSR